MKALSGEEGTEAEDVPEDAIADMSQGTEHTCSGDLWHADQTLGTGHSPSLEVRAVTSSSDAVLKVRWGCSLLTGNSLHVVTQPRRKAWEQTVHVRLQAAIDPDAWVPSKFTVKSDCRFPGDNLWD